MRIEPQHLLSHYRLIEQIGQGGMGVIWRAIDTRLDRNVAIKFLRPELLRDPVGLQRFACEARTAAAASHPNIATIHEIGETDDLVYIVMELVEGKTVRQLLTGGQLPITRSLELAHEIADGLAHAHGSGIIHRDLKPDNMIE